MTASNLFRQSWWDHLVVPLDTFLHQSPHFVALTIHQNVLCPERVAFAVFLGTNPAQIVFMLDGEVGLLKWRVGWWVFGMVFSHLCCSSAHMPVVQTSGSAWTRGNSNVHCRKTSPSLSSSMTPIVPNVHVISVTCGINYSRPLPIAFLTCWLVSVLKTIDSRPRQNLSLASGLQKPSTVMDGRVRSGFRVALLSKTV